MKPTRRLRWWIVWTLFFSTVINYVDRQTLSNLAPVITKEFHMTNAEYGLVVSSFQIAYAVMWLVGGVLLDLIGTRLGLTIAMIWWSLASMLPSLAHSVRFLALSRFLLGIGEGFNWPGASKTVAEWFPAKERGLAVGIFDSGSSVGGALAALLIPWLAIIFGWRAAFLMAGCLGFVWLALWLSLYRPMESHPRLSCRRAAVDRIRQRDGRGVNASWCGAIPVPSHPAQCLGYCSWPFADRPYLVVLHFLAPQVSERYAWLQPEANRRVHVVALRGVGSGKFYRRAGFRFSHPARNAHGAGAQGGLRGELRADPGGHSRRSRPLALLGFGFDLRGDVGIRSVVYDGPYVSF